MPISTQTARLGKREKRFVLLTTSIVTSLIMLDSNIVSVALPRIAQSLHARFAEVEWVLSAYVLAFASLLLVSGSIADLYGRRRAMASGLVIFAGASAACGFATSALQLNVARAVEGVGASLLLTSSLAIIEYTFRGAERAKAYAIWGSCIGLAIAAGPVVGGVITSAFGWRWAFLVNVSVCAALLVATWVGVPESADTEEKRLDVTGSLTFTASLLLLTWAMIDGDAVGWSSHETVTRLLGFAALFSAFIGIELIQRHPMVDLSLFRSRHFLGGAVAMVGYAMGAQVMIFYIPLQLQNGYGLSPAQSGLAMLPFALPMLAAPNLGPILRRCRSERFVLSLGLAITGLGNLGMALAAGADLGFAAFAASMGVTGLGGGLLNGETAKAMNGAVPPDRSGMASGISATTRFTSLLLGIGILGAVLSAKINSTFANLAAQSGLALEPSRIADLAHEVAAGGVHSSLLYGAHPLSEAVVEVAHRSFASGFSSAALGAAACVLVTWALAFGMLRPTLVSGPSAEPEPLERV